jgi:hypothetical protein
MKLRVAPVVDTVKDILMPTWLTTWASNVRPSNPLDRIHNKCYPKLSKSDFLSINVEDFYVDLSERVGLLEELCLEGLLVRFKNTAGECSRPRSRTGEGR